MAWHVYRKVYAACSPSNGENLAWRSVVRSQNRWLALEPLGSDSVNNARKYMASFASPCKTAVSPEMNSPLSLETLCVAEDPIDRVLSCAVECEVDL